jgi:hypothetical protein
MELRKLFVPNINANRTLEIVHELRSMGLQNHIDFNFCFVQKKESWLVLDEDGNFPDEEPWGAEFTFTDDKWATWFTLKYL